MDPRNFNDYEFLKHIGRRVVQHTVASINGTNLSTTPEDDNMSQFSYGDTTAEGELISQHFRNVADYYMDEQEEYDDGNQEEYDGNQEEYDDGMEEVDDVMMDEGRDGFEEGARGEGVDVAGGSMVTQSGTPCMENIKAGFLFFCVLLKRELATKNEQYDESKFGQIAQEIWLQMSQREQQIFIDAAIRQQQSVTPAPEPPCKKIGPARPKTRARPRAPPPRKTRGNARCAAGGGRGRGARSPVAAKSRARTNIAPKTVKPREPTPPVAVPPVVPVAVEEDEDEDLEDEEDFEDMEMDETDEEEDKEGESDETESEEEESSEDED